MLHRDPFTAQSAGHQPSHEANRSAEPNQAESPATLPADPTPAAQELEGILRRLPMILDARCRLETGGTGSTRLTAYVIPETPPITRRSRYRRRAQVLQRWQAIWDGIYAQPAPFADPLLNTVGWHAPDGQPLPEAEMRQWVDHTVARILQRQPRHLLEIGCGSGMLLFRLAPRCERYWATDLSKRALQYVLEHRSEALMEPGRVWLSHRAADDFSDVPPATLDAVVLNSVTQYFPDGDYLKRVLQHAARAVRPGGFIFVGDVRHLSWRYARQAATPENGAEGNLPAAPFQRPGADDQAELMVDPDFFRRLMDAIPAIGRVETHLKRGGSGSDVVRFRYDVVLHVGPRSPLPEYRTIDWGDGWTLASLQAALRAADEDQVAVRGIPNARLQGHEAIDPEAVWAMAAATPFEVDLACSSTAPTGFDAWFHRGVPQGAGPVRHEPPAGSTAGRLTNVPTHPVWQPNLLEVVSKAIKRDLPVHLWPDQLLFVDRLPG